MALPPAAYTVERSASDRVRVTGLAAALRAHGAHAGAATCAFHAHGDDGCVCEVACTAGADGGSMECVVPPACGGDGGGGGAAPRAAARPRRRRLRGRPPRGGGPTACRCGWGAPFRRPA
ncbi:hypothetical protein BU14_0331s0023 [Porphyra umbilicalis]|uniref:Uncharacterized protein n=1 Tax=Porphyra umbilicalis TaxID=2786 RepID=A0A1X6NYX4_PORUM|nr:hypothetical protein BU14_0331s0023 [Porphyra umbilicalis]|eukprot:OSX73706.1 hypothetical protein BU14_0331s0023 [Porphyra umbilicalis]